MSAGSPGEAARPAGRPVRRNRRADSVAGAPAGEQSGPAIIEMPSASTAPPNVRMRPVQLPGVDELPALKDGRVVSRTGQTPTGVTGISPAIGITPATESVPLDPDGQPLTRRQLRLLREQQEREASDTAPRAGTDDEEAVPGHLRRAQAPEGAPAAVEPGVPTPDADAADADAAGTDIDESLTRESLAREAAALAERIEASGSDDPSRVDPELLKEQERLAAKARRLHETGAMPLVEPETAEATGPAEPVRETGTGTGAEGPVTADPGTSVPVSDVADDGIMVVPVPARTQQSSAGDEPAGQPDPVRHEPVQARAAHGLDPLAATERTPRERTLMIVAGVVFALLVIALILAIIL